jgi:quercetin dioxygenase-like cupin family protein
MTLYRWNYAERKFTPTSVKKSIKPEKGARRLRVEKGQRVRAEVATGDLLIQMIEGAWRMQIANSQLTVRHDEAIIIPSGFSHSAEAIEDSFAVQMEDDQEPNTNDSRWAV